MATKAKKIDSRMEKNMGSALFSDTERMEMWFADNWKKFGVTVLAAVVVICAVFGIWQYLLRQEAKAAAAIINAENAETLAAVLEKNSDSKAAAVGRVRLAEMLISDKKYDSAAAEAAKVVNSKSVDPILLDRAKLLLGAVNELKGDTAKAAATYAALGNDTAAAPAVRAEADYAAVRLYIDLKDYAAAKKILAKPRVSGSLTAGYWNNQMNFIDNALQNGEYK